MKRFIEGVDREQSTLLPESLDEWIDESNPVRAVDVFVEGLNLAKLDFKGAYSGGNAAALVPPIGTPETLYLRLSQSRAVEPTSGTRGRTQLGSDLAAAAAHA